MIRRPILALMCSALVCLSTAMAQSGRWVEHDLAGYGNGMPEYDSGDDCLIVTRSLSQYIAIFVVFSL